MRWILLPPIIVGLIASAPALAQPDTGHVIQHYDRAQLDEGVADAIEAQQAIYDYGACLAKARRRQVERYLAMAPFSGSAQTLARQMAMSACLDAGEIQFNPEAIRGPFYQALYRIDFRDPPAIDLSKAPALQFSQGKGAGLASSDLLTNMRRFVECAVRQDSTGARKLAFSRVGSAEEKAAFQELMPEMGSCIVPGDKIAFKRPLLRGLFNEVLYRLSTASVGRPMIMDRK